jgi:hypothetical protein
MYMTTGAVRREEAIRESVSAQIRRDSAERQEVATRGRAALHRTYEVATQAAAAYEGRHQAGESLTRPELYDWYLQRAKAKEAGGVHMLGYATFLHVPYERIDEAAQGLATLEDYSDKEEALRGFWNHGARKKLREDIEPAKAQTQFIGAFAEEFMGDNQTDTNVDYVWEEGSGQYDFVNWWMDRVRFVKEWQKFEARHQAPVEAA